MTPRTRKPDLTPSRHTADHRYNLVAKQPRVAVRIIATPTARELKAQQNYQLHQRVLRYRARGETRAQAAELAGSSVPTVWRLEKRVREEGIDGYLPRTWRSGRKSEFDKLHPPVWVLAAVERLALREQCSVRAAWRQFSYRSEAPPTIAARVRKGVPESFLRATQLRTVKLNLRFGQHVPARESVRQALQGAAL